MCRYEPHLKQRAGLGGLWSETVLSRLLKPLESKEGSCVCKNCRTALKLDGRTECVRASRKESNASLSAQWKGVTDSHTWIHCPWLTSAVDDNWSHSSGKGEESQPLHSLVSKLYFATSRWLYITQYNICALIPVLCWMPGQTQSQYKDEQDCHLYFGEYIHTSVYKISSPVKLRW